MRREASPDVDRSPHVGAMTVQENQVAAIRAGTQTRCGEATTVSGMKDPVRGWNRGRGDVCATLPPHKFTAWIIRHVAPFSRERCRESHEARQASDHRAYGR